MIDYFFDLQDLFPYIYLFPIFLLIIYTVFLIGKRKIDSKGIAFYGIFMGLSFRNILSLSCLFLYYYVILVSIFLNSFSILTFLLLVVPILLFNLVNFYILKFFIDIINTFILFVLLFSKSAFYNYLSEVGVYWYVILLYVILCIFIFMYATYVFIRRFKLVISSNKYVAIK